VKDFRGDRRSFLRRAFGGAVQHVAKATEERIIQRRYIRPPGAIPEIGFLAACTRCGLCAGVCPPGAIRYAGADGGLASGTPFLEPDRVACVACPDMPCAAVCPTGALILPEGRWHGVRLGTITFHPARCVTFRGDTCTACADECPIGDAALVIDADGHPVLKAEGCVACGVCVRACPTSPSSMTFTPPER